MFNDAEGREQGFGFKSFQALLNARQLSAPIADPSEEASINECVARFIEGVSAVASSTVPIRLPGNARPLPAAKGAGAFDRMLKA
ncbi:hypothetical protein [Rhizobium laguerreae]|uniref:hypothetical protein n=1 Tax=Rhizobium laguerreae TaxID=1076926 RepID=UPI001441CC5E|nr:hypothetical protein [Rhizobium laguerreae]